MTSLRLLILGVVLLSCHATAKISKTLVLVDTLATRETHSIFLKTLSDLGHEVTVKSADEPTLQLSRYGQYLYDNVVLFAPGVEEFGGALSLEGIVDFVDDGGNVMVAGSSETSDLIRELCSEVGVEMDEEGAAVIDHLHYDVVKDEGEHTVIATPAAGLLKAPIVVGTQPSSNSAPLLYKGTGLVLDQDNPLVLPILHAASSSYSHRPYVKVSEQPTAGHSVVLLAALQARNNARVVVSGSLDFFSDAFISSAVNTPQGKIFDTSSNGAVVAAVTRWALREAGVLRVVDVSHNKVGASSPPSEYTIKDDIEYHITVQELKDGQWRPFQANDFQLEFVRIDPFVRATLKPSNTGKFSKQFKVPDVYGVYQFKVEYNRVGYTRVYNTTQVAVRPFLHTQYERFIDCAYPYYASAFSMMVGVLLFSIVFVHHKEPTPRPKTD